jgi:UDP-N-acetylglucosamine--N-acetylmuramyl-(pentapeptide) pyrophosphoryl-undecaprenol N-acetylglucosamine transferase
MRHLTLLFLGASSVSELSIVETSDFIPSPNVAEDHQTKNAKSIVDKKGSIEGTELILNSVLF